MQFSRYLPLTLICIHLLACSIFQFLVMVSISSLTNSYFCRSTWSSYWSESFTNISITACCWSISFALNPRISSRLGSSFSFLQSCYFYLNIGFLLIYLIIFCYDLRFLHIFEFYFSWYIFGNHPLLPDYGLIIRIITLRLSELNKNNFVAVSYYKFFYFNFN